MASLGDAGRRTLAALRRRVGRRAAGASPDRAGPILEARVLVVDDEREIRDVLTDYLEGEGCAVATAANGDEALESVRRDPPDVILLDIKMPGVDEVLRLVGATSYAQRPVGRVSGGEQQRLLIAQALVRGPALTTRRWPARRS